MRMLWLFVVLAVVMLALPGAAETLTYVDLVNRLTDLQGLAILPQQGETCAQASSYDRASRYDAQTGKYINWDANGDGSGIIRKEGDSVVIAEMEGPGCIWRTWSALAKEGHVKIYLDGATEPAVDLPFDGYFNLENKPFNYPGLVHTASQGRNCYVPIPYQKSCKIVADKGWGAYYQFTYTTFPKGTVVPTFTRDLGPEETAALERASVMLTTGLGASNRSYDKYVSRAPLVNVAPGQTVTVATIPGPEAIDCLRASIDSKKYTEQQLRSVVLKIYWDGEKTPSVWAPISDFFGSGLGLNQYKSLPMGVTAADAYSYWYMPFAKEARIELTNEGNTEFDTQFYIGYAPLTRPIDQYGRFHAKWHRDAYLPTEKERGIDWPIVKTEGRGRFCGVALEVWNPKGGWWGEGDEKWFVDGEKFPSTFGTGSEDYFGYAWCDPHPFQNAYHNQPRNDNVNNASHVSVNRWQIADSIPFQTSFEGDIEKYFPNNRPTRYAAMAYWYLAPDGKDPYTGVALRDRLDWYAKPIVRIKPGVYEGESMKVIDKPAGSNVSAQGLGDAWSEGSQLFWVYNKPNGSLNLRLDTSKAGKYEVTAQFTKAGDYGIVQMWLDGQKLGDPLDLYNNGVVTSGVVALGTVNLGAGQHRLMVQNLGKNDKSTNYLFGLDYIKLVRK